MAAIANFSFRKMWRTIAAALVFALVMVLIVSSCGGGGGGGDNGNSNASSVPPTPQPVSPIVQPLALPGPYAVACSNIGQDFSRVAAGDDVKTYWEGTLANNLTGRYVTNLLADPVNTLSVTVTAPNNTDLYGSYAGRRIPFVILACYPTAANNPNPNYPLPTGMAVPHMQTGNAAPVFSDAAAKYPVILFSHGYSGSPISSEYLQIMSTFASYGYVMLAPFHGDLRFCNLKTNNFAEAALVLGSFSDVTAAQALRPLSMTAALDLMLGHPQWRDHLDASQIGGFGASMGGETMLLMGGAALTTSLGQSSTRLAADPRLKAAVGYVPYFGQPFLPAFGRDQLGIDGITLPYLGISGTADTTAPIVMAQQGMARLTGTRELIALQGVVHAFDVPSTNDIFTWSLTYFEAMVKGNPVARKQLTTMTSVAGGGDDRVVIPYSGPSQ